MRGRLVLRRVCTIFAQKQRLAQFSSASNPTAWRVQLKVLIGYSNSIMSKISDAIENLEIAEFNNRKIVLSTKEGTPLRIQFPRLYMPFGISGFVPEVGPTKYNVDLALKGYDEEGSYIKNFYESLRQIES